MTVPGNLARALNHKKRMLLGAAGTTLLRLQHQDLQGVTGLQRIQLDMLGVDCQDLADRCKAVAKQIDAFYLEHGSERAKKNIARRQAIRAKLDAGKYEEVTEEEVEFLYNYGRKQK